MATLIENWLPIIEPLLKSYGYQKLPPLTEDQYRFGSADDIWFIIEMTTGNNLVVPIIHAHQRSDYEGIIESLVEMADKHEIILTIKAPERRDLGSRIGSHHIGSGSFLRDLGFRHNKYRECFVRNPLAAWLVAATSGQRTEPSLLEMYPF